MMLPLILLMTSVLCMAQKEADKYSCPEKWSLHEKHCIKAFNSPQRTWEDARKTCQGEAGDLVEIHTPEVTAFVRGLLSRRMRYWIGIHDRLGDRQFWYLDSTEQIGSYHPWARREPNNKGGNERCVEMIANRRGSWNDKRCSKRRRFICQRPAIEKETGPSVYDKFSNDFESLAKKDYVFYEGPFRYAHHRSPNGTISGYVILDQKTSTTGISTKEPVNLPEDSCLGFSFSSLGTNNFRVTWGGDVVFEKPTPTGRAWRTLHVNLPAKTNSKLSLQVPYNVNGGYHVHIDNIDVRPGKCKPSQEETGPGPSVYDKLSNYFQACLTKDDFWEGPAKCIIHWPHGKASGYLQLDQKNTGISTKEPVNLLKDSCLTILVTSKDNRNFRVIWGGDVIYNPMLILGWRRFYVQLPAKRNSKLSFQVLPNDIRGKPVIIDYAYVREGKCIHSGG